MSTEPSFAQVLHDWAEVFMSRSFRDFRRFMEEAELSPSQVAALMRLHHCGNCGVTDLGDHLGVSRPAASQMVDRLVRQGLLERAEHPHDRRARQISLTPVGKSLIQAGIVARRRWIEQLTAALTPQEQQSVAATLDLLTRRARDLEPDK